MSIHAASVSSFLEAKALAEGTNDCPGPATFPEDKLKWVPRKRHNTRWPIEPKSTPTRMVAALQPLIEFELPATQQPADSTQRVDEDKARRRSTRRLSRRLSLFPGDMSPRKLSCVTLSPSKVPMAATSPVKKQAIGHTPKKVAESPLGSFRVNATPTKIVLESPKAGLAVQSPLKSSPAPVVGTCLALKTHAPDPSPLVFDQPAVEISFEPQHETQRRRSLQSARHKDRRSSWGTRPTGLEVTGVAMNRRHSFSFTQNAMTDAKARRKTLDAFFAANEEAEEEVAASDTTCDLTEQNCDEAHGAEVDESQRTCPVVRIDVGTNLDIFGQWQPAVDKEQPQGPPGLAAVEDVTAESNSCSATERTLSASVECDKRGEEIIVPSPMKNVLGVTYKSPAPDSEPSLDQAAMGSDPEVTGTELHNPSAEQISPPISTAEALASGQEASDLMFEHCDPEGLSTIYEESSVLDSEADAPTMPESPVNIFVESLAEPARPATPRFNMNAKTAADCVDDDDQLERSNPATPCSPSPTVGIEPQDAVCDVEIPDTFQRDEMSRLPGSASQDRFADGWGATHASEATRSMQVDSPTDSEKPANEAPGGHSDEQSASEASTNHVVTAYDALSESDSSRQPHEFSTNTAGSPSPSEESVATPENEFCVTTTLDFKPHGDNGPTTATDSIISAYPASPRQESPLHHSHSPNVQTPLGASREPAQESMSSIERKTPSQTTAAGSIRSPGSSMNVISATLEEAESSGFTPINGRQISPPGFCAVSIAEDIDSETESGDADQVVEEEAMIMDYEMTESIDDDLTLTVVAPRIENDTLTLQASHDDSETEMLRQFVTRVAADKNAKAAAAAAAALAKKSGRPKRRSGSTGSTASSTGSPIAKSDTPVKRTPLGEKNTNSPSPVKKRKLGADTEKGGFSVPDLFEDTADAPKLKRRRKRGDPVLESTTSNFMASVDSDAASSEPGPRRSTRSRNSRVTLKPTAPSANSIALSLIPVRLPGMSGMMDDATMESHLMMAKSRSDEKDIVAVTRVNTRKNKANAVHPRLVLARQAEDPAWRMRELKTVFDAKESRSTEALNAPGSDGRKTKKVKAVRWAEELVRFQGEEAPSAFKAMASSLLADIMMGDAVKEAEERSAEPKVGRAATEPEQAEQLPATPAKKALPRRTRSSRLLAPTPVDKIMEKPAPSPARPVRVAGLSKAPVTPSVAKPGIATRRSKIAKLGMGVNGTPAPKRRGRPAV